MAEPGITLHKIMADDPASFVMIICDVFKPASGESREPTEDARRRASVGYRVLDSFHVLPGLDGQELDVDKLREWVGTVRRLAQESDRAKIADEFIGHLFAYAPSDSDGFWPHIAIRTTLEELQSDQIELGIQIERSNMRGVVTKAMYEGGGQERTLAEQARAQSKGLKNGHERLPYGGGLLKASTTMRSAKTNGPSKTRCGLNSRVPDHTRFVWRGG